VDAAYMLLLRQRHAMIRTVTASLDDPALTERVLAVIAGQYRERQHHDGTWVRAAAWLGVVPGAGTGPVRDHDGRDRYGQIGVDRP
jgi:hypothetical protein